MEKRGKQTWMINEILHQMGERKREKKNSPKSIEFQKTCKSEKKSDTSKSSTKWN